MSLSPADATTITAHQMGVDQAARDAELEWGVDRLPFLVDAELRARFLLAQSQWSEVLNAAWSADILTRDMLDLVTRKAAALIRGWAKLAEVASEAGHRRLSPDVWTFRLTDGSSAAITRTTAEAAAEIRSGRNLRVYTLEEVAHLIEAAGFVGDVKDAFPGAVVTGGRAPPTDRSWTKSGDDIPF